jgi:hypothetical protein
MRLGRGARTETCKLRQLRLYASKRDGECTNLVVENQSRDNLLDLQDRHIFTQTNTSAGSELVRGKNPSKLGNDTGLWLIHGIPMDSLS